NDTRPDHGQCTRQMIQLEQIITDEDPLAVKGNMIASRRLCSGGNDNIGSSDITPASAVHIFQSYGVAIYEGGFRRDELHSIALQLVPDNVKFVLNDMVGAEQEV